MSNSDASMALAGGIGVIVWLLMMVIYIAIIVFYVVCMCKYFKKLGEPWWKAIIPFYNNWVLFSKLTEKNIMWFIFTFIPFLNIAAVAFALVRMPMVLDMGVGAGIANLFLSAIMLPVMAFNKKEYIGHPLA